ncbi:MAG: hypothetical protein ACRDHZ_13965 [Ktedonobacteraceae bacterium]
MTSEQKIEMQISIDVIKKRIQAIEASPCDFEQQIRQIDFELVLLLDHLVNTLPKPLRLQAQTCMQARKSVRDAQMLRIQAEIAHLNAQKEASPNSLTTTD